MAHAQGIRSPEIIATSMFDTGCCRALQRDAERTAPILLFSLVPGAPVVVNYEAQSALPLRDVALRMYNDIR